MPDSMAFWLSGPRYRPYRKSPAGGTGNVSTTVARAVRLLARGNPTAIAPPNLDWFSSKARAAAKKYFDLTPAHSNGPSSTRRWPASTDEKSVRFAFEDFVTSA